jgi:hypothetical protein
VARWLKGVRGLRGAVGGATVGCLGGDVGKSKWEEKGKAYFFEGISSNLGVG